MTRTSFLMAGSAMALALSSAVTAQAATCSMGATLISCTELNSDPVESSQDGVKVTVDAAASVVVDDKHTDAIALSGDDVSVENAGTIQQQSTGKGGHAISGSGNGIMVTNTGTIESGDRAIEMDGGSKLHVINYSGATISARRQAVRAGTDSPGATVENYGTITSAEGRALQLRSDGAHVINRGALIGAEEVVEARGNFLLENYGTIQLNDPTILDEDGVQFAGGEVRNHGLIEGTDDGVDIDQGLITNYSDGTIRSISNGEAHSDNGIDIDAEYDDGINPVRPAGDVTIVNQGVIEGPRAIGADDAAENKISITNGGTLRGIDAAAIQLAPHQGDSSLSLLGNSLVFGDVNFGSGNDVVKISNVTSGSLITDGVFHGDKGDNSVIFDLLGLDDFTSFDVAGNKVDLSFMSGGDELSGTFFDFGKWMVGSKNYTTAELNNALNGSEPAPVPLPAGLPMLLAGLGGLAMLRRRRRS